MRVASFRNILETGRIGLLFLVPGIGETLHVNGRAALGAVAQQRSDWLTVATLRDEAGANDDAAPLMQPAIGHLDATDLEAALPSRR